MVRIMSYPSFGTELNLLVSLHVKHVWMTWLP